MIGYKLLRKKADGSLTSLFINKHVALPIGKWMRMESHPTDGFAVRPGWHVLAKRSAPHLSKKGRVWAKVEISGYEEIRRPKSQGGMWFLAERMRILEVYT